MENLPIVFLDIDGVLNRTKHAKHIRFEEDLVERLKRIVDQTNAQIVISSFWRHFHEYIAYVLDRYGIAASRVVGATPGLGHHKDSKMIDRSSDDIKEYTCRSQEIKVWLAKHAPENANYVILDDRPSAADGTQLERFVFCKTELGLTEEDADKAIEILTRSNRANN